VGFAILALVVVHGLWSLVRGSARDLFTLRALGSTPRQLDQVTAWQAAPFAVVALLVGLPVGVAAGRWSFMQFARSLAVVEDASLPPLSALALVGAVALALVLAVVGVAVVVRRRPVTLRLLED
jgi:ABC-type lipoprotein release transport system permease subunit